MVAPKREKMACQRSMTQKKREREKGVANRSKSYPSIHPSTHTLAPFDRDCMTCFSMDPLFDFTINRIQVCPVLILP